jgi:hypothetical protein
MKIRLLVIILATLSSTGCGGSSAKVTGRVTCQGKPVVGIILFSPKDQGSGKAGAAATADLNDDGRYQLPLTSTGMHTVVVTPRDVVLRPKKGEFDYPCDRSPLERDIKAGDNGVTIDLAKRVR